MRWVSAVAIRGFSARPSFLLGALQPVPTPLSSALGGRDVQLAAWLGSPEYTPNAELEGFLHSYVGIWPQEVLKDRRGLGVATLRQRPAVPIYRLTRELSFPLPQEAEPSGLLAVGGDLQPERLLLAYSMGIFPWYDDELPILWHSPDPRMVLRPRELRVSRSLRRLLRQRPFAIRLDGAFERVIRSCAQVHRKDQDGTWITAEMIDAYAALAELGYAHCAEAWAEGELVGGLYGVSLGGCFFGESMFALRPDASKVAFVALVRQLEAWDFDLVDCQIRTEHLARFGASEWRRGRFLAALRESLERPTRRGPWQLDPELEERLEEGNP